MSAPKEEKKEMLGVGVCPDSGKQVVRINYSSLSLLNTCLRKSDYLLNRGLMSKDQSPPLVFGSAIHKALEVWYLSDPKERKVLPTSLASKLALEAFGTPQGTHPAFIAAGQFAELMAPLSDLPDEDRRSILNGTKILAAYFSRYKDDGLTVVRDAEGPIIERRVEFTIYEDADLRIQYFGTIDAVLKNEQTGIVCVADHKTTSVLGSQFFNRIKPNHQYTGYVWGAQKCLNLDTKLFLVNGLQVVKTKQDFARQFTERTEEDFEELRDMVVRVVENYLKSKRTGIWPQNAPDPCTNWGGCAFLKVCEVPKKLRETLIKANWEEN